MTPEFSRPVRIDSVGEKPRAITITAEPDERAALARRFGLVSIERLETDCAVRRENERLFVEGRLRGEVVQSCVASGEPLPASLDIPFSLRFVPEESAEAADEVELSAEDCDTLVYEGGVIDLGEVAAETLALSLDPFPRSPDADAVLKQAGVLEEGEAGPFAALKGLRDKLTK